MAALVTGAGLLSAVAAAAGGGPFAGLRPVTPNLAGSQVPAVPIDASVLYPAPTPAVIHKVVDMYDLPPVARSPIAAPKPIENEHPSNGDSEDTHPSPPPQSQPSPSPGGDDGGVDH